MKIIASVEATGPWSSGVIVLSQALSASHSLLPMRTVVCRIGDAAGIVLDEGLLERAGISPGDVVSVEIDPAGRITVSPLGRESGQDTSRAIRATMSDYRKTMKKLT